MRAPFYVLRLTALVFLTFGLWGLISPASLLGTIGVELPVPSAVAEMRGFYGGLEIGVALFLLYSSRSARYAEPAALMPALGLSGLVLGRLVGVLVDGPANVLFYLSGAMEALGAVACIWAYRRMRHRIP